MAVIRSKAGIDLDVKALPMTTDPRPLIGAGPALDAVRRAVARVAPTDATVLVLGETGTGKELVARALHDAEPAARPGVRPGQLRGAGAGARHQRAVRPRGRGVHRGRRGGASGGSSRPHGGTLFLDEIGEMPPEAQALLLRALQERVVERVGGGGPVPVDVRVVAATNRDLAAEVGAGRFRADLFYRLNVFPITVPPLRDRPSDVPELAAHFVRLFAARHGRPVSRVPPPVLRALAAHGWPGNVRELQNLVERAVILSDGPDLAFDAGWLAGGTAAETAKTWAAQERQRILDALRAADGRVYGPGGAAHRLGLNPTTLYGKMRKHGLSRGGTAWA